MSITAFHDTAERGDVKVFPMSLAQEGLWFLDQLEPASAAYNLPVAIRPGERLDVEILERSLNELVQRHEALRTTFGMRGGQLVQLIAPTLTIPLPVVDLRSLAEEEREAEAQRVATQEAQRPFDLTGGPLVRAAVLHLAAEEGVLLLTVHRIVCDGWSLGVLLRELATLYEAFSTGRPWSLPEVPMRYADFAVRQQEWLQGETAARHLAYWKQQLAGSPAGLELPTDRPHLPIPTWRGATYGLTLPKALAAALRELSGREGVTPYMTLVAAFQTLLYRYTGQDDLVIGTVTAGRTRAETEALIGLFENALVLRADLSGTPTFRELLGRMREVILGAQAHQELPLEYLVKELQPERQLRQNPLFQVMLTLEPAVPALPAGWTLTQLGIETGTSRFDLTLELEDRPEGLRGRFQYSSDLFDRATIARMAGHWQTLLEGIVADPTRRLWELPLLAEAERHQLLVEWNATASDYPKEQCLHQLFEAQVERTPEAVALVCEGQQMTYRELNARANQLAHYLQRLGVGPEVRVGLCIERSLEMVVGLLGILKAGGAYVPLDPGYPKDRLAFMLQDAQVSVLLTQQRLVEELPTHEKVVCLDAGWKMIGRERAENLVSGTTSENLAYIMYTSGSTGRPKGVLGTHRAAINRFHWMWTTYPFEPEEGCCQKTALSFVDSVWEIFGPLLQGIRTVIIPDIVVKDPQQLLQTLAAHAITRIVLVPSLLRVLLDTADDLEDRLPGLKYWISSGEALPVDLALRFLHTMPHRVLLNLYGSSEVAADATFYDARSYTPSLACIPIGRPIANTQIYLLDRHMQPVPIGVPGELHVGGDGLARGYFNRPELTVARFVPNPFTTELGACLYKTGDWVRYLPDGDIEYLGRIDHQVKLRGFRIELGEIEAVLGQHPAVGQAVVMAREDAPGDKRLVAYVVPHEGQKASADELKNHVRKQVPTYMVPSAFVFLETLPLTPNGKVDRRALPAPGPSSKVAEETFVAPTRLVHQQLAQIWEELLDARPIGIRDNFFDLGGHSFLAARLIERIEQATGKSLPLSILFAGATIEHLATALMGEAKTDFRTPLVAVQASGSRRPFFFLHGQWTGGAFYCLELARSLGPDQPFYVLEPYKFDGLAVPPTLEAIAAAHLEALRSVQPQGPYLLGGWCNGGLMAYEMARQLHAQGQRVDRLVLMDPDPPAPHQWERRLISGLGKLLRLSQEKQVDCFLAYRYLRLCFYYWRLNKRQRMRTPKPGEPGLEPSTVGAIPPRLTGLIPSREVLRQDWLSIYNWVAAGYMPRSYPGTITFFWTEEEPLRREGWRKVMQAKTEANEVEIQIIPGNHITSRTEYLPVLAEQLCTCLGQAQATVVS